MQKLTDYHKKIIEYYNATENAYKDAWDLEKSLSIHYGYEDETTHSFSSSLLRMNEIMMEAIAIRSSDHVLDAGCGIGGSSIFLAKKTGCKVTGITLSARQVKKALENAEKNGVKDQLYFEVADFCETPFHSNSFDVIWGCESICYAYDKSQFIDEAYRLLKPGGRLVVADGFVTNFENNEHPYIQIWLEGWQVNFLESPQRFNGFMHKAGFVDIKFRDISSNTLSSSHRLNRFYYLASLYLFWKKLTFTDRSSSIQRKNIKACRYQYLALCKGLWQYGLTTGRKPI